VCRPVQQSRALKANIKTKPQNRDLGTFNPWIPPKKILISPWVSWKVAFLAVDAAIPHQALDLALFNTMIR
jgi:hypothetical protein